MTEKKPSDWYFAINLGNNQYEIQSLGSTGRSMETIQFNNPVDKDMALRYRSIIEKLKRYTRGKGDYFNIHGDVLDFQWNKIEMSSNKSL